MVIGGPCWRLLAAFPRDPSTVTVTLWGLLLRITFHLIVAGLYLTAIVHVSFLDDYEEQLAAILDPNEFAERQDYAGNWKFLTHWNLSLQLITFCICLATDTVDLKSWRVAATGGETQLTHRTLPMSGIHQVRDLIFLGLSFPLSLLVFINFWSLYLVDPSLVVDTRVPLVQWRNHVTHTIIVPVSLAEATGTYHTPGGPRWVSMILMFTFTSAYATLMFYAGAVKGSWSYPILAQSSWPTRLAIAANSYLELIVFHFTANYYHATVWRGNANNNDNNLRGE